MSRRGRALDPGLIDRVARARRQLIAEGCSYGVVALLAERFNLSESHVRSLLRRIKREAAATHHEGAAPL